MISTIRRPGRAKRAAGNPAARLVRGWAGCWRPRSRLPHGQWATENVRIPTLTGSTPGPYSIARYPYVAGVLEAADDPQTEEIILPWSAQNGKTTLMQALALCKASQEPAPMIWAAPNEEEMKRNRDDLYRLADASPALRQDMPPRWRRNYRVVDFGSALCYLGFPGNTQRISGRSCQWVFCTELDRWEQTPHEGDTISLVDKRTKAWFRFLRVKESTPTHAKGPIWQAWLRSDQRQFYVPCPHCGEFQILRFFPYGKGHPKAGKGGVHGYKDAEGRLLDPDSATKNAHYRCEHCDGRIEEHHRRGMLRLGKWVPKGKNIDKNGVLSGKSDRSARVAGFHLSFLYAPAISWARAVQAWLDCGEDAEKKRAFVNNDLALPYEQASRRVEWQEAAKRLSCGHARGTVPPGAFFLTCGMDVQQERIYWAVRAWGENKRSWLVDAGFFQQQIGEDGGLRSDSDLEQFRTQVLPRRYRLLSCNAVGVEDLPIALVGVDAGYGDRINDVHRFVRACPGGRVRALVGQGKLTQHFERSLIDRNARTGKRYEGGLERWAISEAIYQSELQQRISATAESASAWLLCGQVLPAFEDYLRQLVNEAPVWTKNRSGKDVMEWRPVDQHVGNHYRDCEKYNLALADMVAGPGGWDLESLTRMAAAAIVQRGQGQPRRRQLVEPARDEFAS